MVKTTVHFLNVVQCIILFVYLLDGCRVHVEHAFLSFAGTYTEVLALLEQRGDTIDKTTLCVETIDLQFVELYVELLYELVEYIVAITHELCRLFLCHLTRFENLRCLEIREKQDKYFPCVSRDFNKVDMTSSFLIKDLVEISVEDLSSLSYSLLIVTNDHGWWTLSSNQVKVVIGLLLLMLLLLNQPSHVLLTILSRSLRQRHSIESGEWRLMINICFLWFRTRRESVSYFTH